MVDIKANFPNFAADTIQLSPSTTPGYTHAATLTEASAKRASELLTINHSLYHTRWNAGFHNHMVHHLLSLWAVGASPEEIQDMWDYNEPYQAPIDREHTAVSDDLDMKDPVIFNECYGKDKHYLDFLRFFRDEVSQKGVPDVIREYLLKGDERANDIFGRMYTDLVHPMIHLGCAVEFQQPSLVAEALAAACVHENWPKEFLLPTEEYVRSNVDMPSVPLLQIIENLRSDPEIASCVKASDPFNKIADGLMKRLTGKQLAPYLGKFRVKPTAEDLQQKLSEMMHVGAYMMGAAQQPGRREAIDFVLLHNVTLACHYPAILAQDWLSNEEKARLLEAKARVDLVMYAGCGSPALYPSRIIDYVPLHPADGWNELFHRAIVYRDEGHAVKLIRALFCLSKQPAATGSGLPIAKEDFVKIAHMCIDSIETALKPGGVNMPKEKAEAVVKNVGHGGEMVLGNMTRWVFYDGLPGAWDHVPEMPTQMSGQALVK